MKNLRFICAQPAIPYYVWQVEVLLNNFKSMGINLNNVDVVCWKVNNVIPDDWISLANGYPARFLFYEDTRETKNYISSIRPNILKQHFQAFPDLENEAIFYHDCDIVFTKPINWEQFLQDDNWYGSDCRWYIGHDYILSKGENIISEMCRIADIDKELVKSNELNSIGAQYLMKNINADYWQNVESICEVLFKDITTLNNTIKAETPAYHEVQIWCADMWAVLWEGWKRGNKTICHPDLEFAWATSSVEDWEKFNIFHNAGVTGPGDLFYKADYMNKLPYNALIEVKDNTASKKYWEIIQETAKKSVLL